MASDDLIAEHLKAYHCGESLTVSSKMLEMTFQMRGGRNCAVFSIVFAAQVSLFAVPIKATTTQRPKKNCSTQSASSEAASKKYLMRNEA